MLRLKAVSYQRGFPVKSRNSEVLDKISFSAAEKEHSIVYGDNGSGKSTIVRLLLNLIKQDSGSISRPRGGLVAVFEDIESQLLFSSVKEELESAGNGISAKNGNSDKDEILSVLGIKEFKERSTMELSYSQKARVVFAVSYLSGKEYMVLDSLPADKNIDNAVSLIAEKNLRTLIVFLPTGVKRDYRGDWNSYLLKRSKIKRL
ncbi:MAG: ATP-binding cassette domain-containing protein [Elusimicrobia bacterium]|jgi:energy-coupling factor transporter ATP-binding protein EcfA2|nr:ATP-binding cassette domain-containing protein [Elusimicrobiota bacterium]